MTTIHSKLIRIIAIVCVVTSIIIGIVALSSLKKESNKIENEKEATVEIQFDKEDFNFEENNEVVNPESSIVENKEKENIINENDIEFDNGEDSKEIGTPQVEIKDEDVKVLDEGIVETYVHFGDNETATIPY